MTIQEFVKSYNIELVEMNGKPGLRAKKPKTEARIKEYLSFGKENKQAIIDYLTAVKEEKEAAARARFEFVSSGFESHVLFVDTRNDIDEQLKKYAALHQNDCTFESLRRDYDSAVAKAAEKQEKRDSKTQEIFDKAAETGEKQLLNRDIIVEELPGKELSKHIIYSTWAMPDGTTTSERTIGC